MREIGGVAFYEESDDIESWLDDPNVITVVINGERLYPACQFEDDESTVRGIRSLLTILTEKNHARGHAMQEADLSAHLDWLFSPHFGAITPIEWLRLGRDPKEVENAAHLYLDAQMSVTH